MSRRNYDEKEEDVLPIALEPKEVSKRKIQFKVINIVKNDLLLEDSKGNLVRVPISNEYGNVKIGDVLSI